MDSEKRKVYLNVKSLKKKFCVSARSCTLYICYVFLFLAVEVWMSMPGTQAFVLLNLEAEVYCNVAYGLPIVVGCL